MLIDFLHRRIQQKFRRRQIRSRYLKLPTCSLHYYTNEAEFEKNVLFLHGLGTSSSTWIHVLPHLARKHNVFALDFPGFGFSRITSGKPTFTIQELCETVEAFVVKTVRLPFILVGHSLGGWIAAEYAIRHQADIARLVLMNPAGIHHAGVEETGKLFAIRNLRELYSLLNRLWWKYPWYFKPFAPAILADLRRRRVQELIETVAKEDFLNDRLQGLTIPVDLIWGQNDAVISAEVVELLKRALPQLRVRFIEKCGHVPQLERPRSVKAFLDEILEERDDDEGGRGEIS
ncbi:MAG: alpha/beta fold hydrolase [Bacteroidota bacterium]